MSVIANAPIYQFWWEVPTSKRFLELFLDRIPGMMGVADRMKPEDRAEYERLMSMRDLEYESLATSAGRPAWNSSMIVLKLRKGGLFVYSPWLSETDGGRAAEVALDSLGEVKVAFVPRAHLSGLKRFQDRYPNAIYIAGESLPDYRIDLFLSRDSDAAQVVTFIGAEFDWLSLQGEYCFLHKATCTFIGCDHVYKTNNEGYGPGSSTLPANTPEWFARANHCLYYEPSFSSGQLYPTYANSDPRVDCKAVRAALLKFKDEWQVQQLVACHVEPVCSGAMDVLQRSLAWAQRSPADELSHQQK